MLNGNIFSMSHADRTEPMYCKIERGNYVQNASGIKFPILFWLIRRKKNVVLNGLHLMHYERTENDKCDDWNEIPRKTFQNRSKTG